MSLDYKIVPLHKKIKVNSKIPNFLPQPCFRLCIIAPSFSGKSTLIQNLLQKKFGYKKYFSDNIFLFSKTSDVNDEYDELINEKNIKNCMDYDFLDELIKEQEENINNYEKYNTNCLLIFDDMITDLNNNDEMMKKLFFMGRHYLFSIIITSQTYHGLPKNYRLNCSHMIIYLLPDKDIKSIIDEISIKKINF